MSIETDLYMEIESCFEAMREMELGSDQYEKAVDSTVKLLDRAYKINEHDSKLQEEVKAREEQHALELKKMQRELIYKLVGYSIEVIGIVLPLIVTVWGTLTSIDFERVGTITTIMGREFIKKLMHR